MDQIITSADFVKSSSTITECPPPDLPEYAFIGRSNVGKSSLINLLTGRSHLAKVSGRPGKTQLINHFLINERWYLVDLPGYGWAQASKKEKAKWKEMIDTYLLHRQNLVNVFQLIDSRHEPQTNDLKFMEWLGEHDIPFSLVFTKLDKLGKTQWTKHLTRYQHALLNTWEALPPMLTTSSTNKMGREELLAYIEQINRDIEA